MFAYAFCHMQLMFQSDSTECVTKKRWEVIQSAFSKDIRSTQELEQAILTYNPEYTKIWNFEPLHTLFDHVSSVSTITIMQLIIL